MVGKLIRIIKLILLFEKLIKQWQLNTVYPLGTTMWKLNRISFWCNQDRLDSIFFKRNDMSTTILQYFYNKF